MNKHINNILCLFIVLPLFASANTELPDPTRPANYIVEDIGPVYVEEVEMNEQISWKLSAIRISKNDKTAIVNGKLVRVGDEVSFATISEINPLSVVINYEDKKLIVRLFNNRVIKNFKSPK